jgi:hypothetical protein
MDRNRSRTSFFREWVRLFSHENHRREGVVLWGRLVRYPLDLSQYMKNMYLKLLSYCLKMSTFAAGL